MCSKPYLAMNLIHILQIKYIKSLFSILYRLVFTHRSENIHQDVKLILTEYPLYKYIQLILISGDQNYGRNKLSHRTASQLSVARQKEQDWRLSYRPEGPMLNNKYFPRDHFTGSGSNGNGHGPTSISSTNKIMDDLSLG